MIKLNGKYDIGGYEYLNCDIQIKKGMLNVVKNDNDLGEVTNPINRTDYIIIKTEDEYGLPITHKYAIKFIDYCNKECYVYTDMCLLTKWWIEIWKSKKFKLCRLLLWIVTIIAATILTVLTEKKINSFMNPSSNTKTEKQNK